MPGFGDPLTGLSLNRNLTKEELIRAIRFMVAAEYEAVEMYGKVADASPDPKIKEAIESVIKEERVHAGEFLKMISYLDPEEEKLYQEGAKETENALKNKTATNRVIRAFLKEDHV
jgi:rubrerythrin